MAESKNQNAELKENGNLKFSNTVIPVREKLSTSDINLSLHRQRNPHNDVTKMNISPSENSSEDGNSINQSNSLQSNELNHTIAYNKKPDSLSGSNDQIWSSSSIHSTYFEKQPPNNLRKSNFFHFDLVFTDDFCTPLAIEKGSFVEFYENSQEDAKFRNGILYKITFKSKNVGIFAEELLVRLVDSVSKRIITYDGHDKNPDMCRVLLTHEIMCSRCSENKSCGNKNETPSDPVVLNNKHSLRFHMKCNQNCLKNAGNPRETRRFQVMISKVIKVVNPNKDKAEYETKILATSENMFVHNNSKHGRKPNTSSQLSISGQHNSFRNCPSITMIIPKDGKQTGCEEVAIIGENFHQGIQIAFGNQFAYYTEVITQNLIKAITPLSGSTGNVELKCYYSNKLLNIGSTTYFKYINDNINHLDIYFEKLWILLPKQGTELEIPPKEEIIKRACEFLDLMYSTQSAIGSRCPQLPLALPMSKDSLNGPDSSAELYLSNNMANFNNYSLKTFDNLIKNGIMMNTTQGMPLNSNEKIVSHLVNSIPMDSPSMIQPKNKYYTLRKRPASSIAYVTRNDIFGEMQSQINAQAKNCHSVNESLKGGFCDTQSALGDLLNLSNPTQGVNSMSSLPENIYVGYNQNMQDGSTQFCNITENRNFQRNDLRPFNDEKNQLNDSQAFNFYLTQQNVAKNFDVKHFVNTMSSDTQNCNQNVSTFSNGSDHSFGIQTLPCSQANYGNGINPMSKRL